VDQNEFMAPQAVRIGGMSKGELLAALQRSGIELNEIAQVLFAHEGFATSEEQSVVETAEVSVAELGHQRGATFAELLESADKRGLSPCPLELAAHLRLQFMDQPEGSVGHPPSKHQAPPGSLTIASRPLAADDGALMGFYLRRILGVLWLRGYRSPAAHIWQVHDRLVFCRQGTVAVA
jgi:hypothetical protein